MVKDTKRVGKIALFGKAWAVALARGALAMYLQIAWIVIILL